MATTEKGIYYPDDYEAVGDIPADMKQMAESIDCIIQNKILGFEVRDGCLFAVSENLDNIKKFKIENGNMIMTI